MPGRKGSRDSGRRGSGGSFKRGVSFGEQVRNGEGFWGRGSRLVARCRWLGSNFGRLAGCADAV